MMVYWAMKKMVHFLAVVLLLSITSHMYYDVVSQFNSTKTAANTELSGKYYTSDSNRSAIHPYIVHAHDNVCLRVYSFLIRATDYKISQPYTKLHNLPALFSAFWHPPQH